MSHTDVHKSNFAITIKFAVEEVIKLVLKLGFKQVFLPLGWLYLTASSVLWPFWLVWGVGCRVGWGRALRCEILYSTFLVACFIWERCISPLLTFRNPSVSQISIDDSWGDWGKLAALLRYRTPVPLASGVYVVCVGFKTRLCTLVWFLKIIS